MKSLAWLLALAIVTSARAADPIPLWPHGAPGETSDRGAEQDTSKPGEGLVAGRSVIRLGNVSQPTITVYAPPPSQNTGAAVVVCPGGGYRILAYDLEGTEICDWLNSIGVTGVLLKYRVPAQPNQERYTAPLQDAQRALGMVRAHAEDWKIDSKRVGILGFSAGGHLSAAASCNYDKRTYPEVDAADHLSCRPDFAVIVYPGYLVIKEQGNKIAPELNVTSNTPPTFLVQTEDDPVRVENSVYYFLALKNAGVPAELHAFPAGGHGYGLRPSAKAKAVTGWPKLAEEWMRGRGLLKAGS
ncbi:MAG TPA: alpha/beta hydrolase [Verrucomicrobiae bacterium]|jgi:acetyl esterase/lipase|nr:alpha/beta hydrolase [Verrucomicrobiae bacterium]